MSRPSEPVEEDISRLALDSPTQPPDGEKKSGLSSGTRVTNPASASASSNRTRGHRRSASHRGLTSAFQQLQVSEAGNESPEPQSQRPAADLPQWGLQSGQPSYQDPYGGQYRFPTGQFSPMQWMPVHPAMGYSMYGDARPSMYFDPRLQNMPFRPGFPPMPPVMQGPFPGMADPRFHMMPMNYFQGSAQAPPVRHQPPRSPRLPADLSQSYDFDVEEVEKSPESCRKTLMLRNIPNKYSIHMLLEMLDKANRSPADELIYDFCYLPIDFKNRCNLGYAFVNFVDAGSTLECYKAFHGKRWNDFNSKKVCEVKYGRVQGREALIEHFKNSKFPSNDIDSLPLLFERIQNGDGSFGIQSVPLHSRQTAVQTQEL